jgi:hypothetical protein
LEVRNLSFAHGKLSFKGKHNLFTRVYQVTLRREFYKST